MCESFPLHVPCFECLRVSSSRLRRELQRVVASSATIISLRACRLRAGWVTAKAILLDPVANPSSDTGITATANPSGHCYVSICRVCPEAQKSSLLPRIIFVSGGRVSGPQSGYGPPARESATCRSWRSTDDLPLPVSRRAASVQQSCH